MFVIFWNHVLQREWCPLCGAEFYPAMGYDIMLKEDSRLVCDSCAEEHAPELVHLILQCDHSTAPLAARPRGTAWRQVWV